MDISFLKEIKLISICFNPLKDTAFVLYKEKKTYEEKPQPDNLYLVEEDIYKKIILKRFKLPQKSELLVTNLNFKKNAKHSLEGYFLHFWKESEKLILVYPIAYISIYDYNSTELIHHFHCPGTNNYSIGKVIASPIENCIFISGENLGFIYCLDYSLISKQKIGEELFNSKVSTSKDILSIVLHPQEKYFFAGFADGIIRIYDYNDIKIIKEFDLPMKLDYYLTSGNSSEKKDSNAIKEMGGVTCLDMNTLGDILIEGTEGGYITLWDSSSCIQNKYISYITEKIDENIISIKFLKTKQFGLLQQFFLLTKSGNLHIYDILTKDTNSNQNETDTKNVKKELIINSVFKKNIFETFSIPPTINKDRLCLSNLINISTKNNILSLSYPKFIKLTPEQSNGKCHSVLDSFIAKIFFFYRIDYPKINYPCSIQLKNYPYPAYFPVQGQPNYENKIFYADNYFIYIYEISTGRYKKLINYAKEFGDLKIYLIKFDIKDMGSKVIFFMLIRTEFNRNYLLIIDFDFENNKCGKMNIFEKINDFVILGNSHLNIYLDFVFFLSQENGKGFIFQLSNFNLNKINIGKNIIRAYHSPFSMGYCLIYQYSNNEFKFSQNFVPEIGDNNNPNNPNMDFNILLNLQSGELPCFNLEPDEIITDILYNLISDYCFCVLSMLDKIKIYNKEMQLISCLKFDMIENPNITASLYFLDCTLIYSRGPKIYYYYPNDKANQLIFTNTNSPCFISGILPDRFFLVSFKEGNLINVSQITSPMISPLEPILIGILDIPNIDKEFIMHGALTMFNNQVSQNLIDKLIKKNFKELAWMFMNDDNYSLPITDMRINFMNDNFKFDNFLDNFDFGKDLTKKLDLDELIWRFNYDETLDYVKNLLIKEAKVLISYGKYDTAIKILELLGDYPLSLNLLLLSTSEYDFEMLRTKFKEKEALNFTDEISFDNLFNFGEKSKDNLDNFLAAKKYNLNNVDIGDIFVSENLSEIKANSVDKYHKIFDNYEGEHFIFGANQNEFKINCTSDIEIQNDVIKSDPNRKIIDLLNIKKPSIIFGQKNFQIFADDYDINYKQFNVIEIASQIFKKIENYYGKRTLARNENDNMNTFFNYDLEKQKDSGVAKTNTPYVKSQDIQDEDDIDPNINIDEINEALYLTAYYHMDKGVGRIIEDATDNRNDGLIGSIYNSKALEAQNNQNKKKDEKVEKEEREKYEDLKEMWSGVLELNNPLEFEDKWGRKVPQPHSIIFKKELKTKITIKYSKSFYHLTDKFTIEFWIKFNDISSADILKIDALNFDLFNGIFKITCHKQEIPEENIKEYTLPVGEFIHLCLLYKRTSQCLSILINCEEISKFNFLIPDEKKKVSIVFGNGNFEGEIAEIRFWNKKMPLEYIKENYKMPLPILSETKSKLKMNIKNIKKNKIRENRIFEFGAKKNIKIDEKPNPNENNNENNFDNDMPPFMDNDFANNLPEEEYPSMDLVYENNPNNKGPKTKNSNEFAFQEKDFEFEQ